MKDLNVLMYKSVNVKLDNIKERVSLPGSERKKRGEKVDGQGS